MIRAALNRMSEIVVEHLDFRSPGLSRRMSRLIRNCGRSIFRAKPDRPSHLSQSEFPLPLLRQRRAQARSSRPQQLDDVVLGRPGCEDAPALHHLAPLVE